MFHPSCDRGTSRVPVGEYRELRSILGPRTGSTARSWGCSNLWRCFVPVSDRTRGAGSGAARAGRGRGGASGGPRGQVAVPGWPCLGHAAVCARTESALQVPVTECDCRGLGWESWEMKSRRNKINADAEPRLFQHRRTGADDSSPLWSISPPG